MAILAPTDFSESSHAAVRLAARHAKAAGQQLVLLHCLESAVDDTPWRHLMEMPRNLRARFWKAARTRLEEMLAELVPADQRPDSVDYRVELKYAEDGIAATLEDTDVEMIFIGATGQGRIANFFLGSTAEDVARMSPAPVMVVPAEADVGPFERIVAPVDFTECSRRSFERAVELARRDGAELVVLHGYVLPVTETTFLPAQMPPETIEAFEEQRKRQLEEFVADFDLRDIEYRTVLEVGSPHNVIVDTVEDVDADLVVMGTHGRRGVQRVFLGSNATKVLRRMPCAVMTVRTPNEAAARVDDETPEAADSDGPESSA